MSVLSYFPGGAGAALNLKAYAAAGNLPASAAQGAVGVITAAAVGGVFASASAPSSPANGDVWVWLGGTTRAPMALGERITLAPRAVYQRVSGAWAIKPAYVYTGGAWAEVSLHLYDAGSHLLASGETAIYTDKGGWTQNEANLYLWCHDGSYTSKFYMGFSTPVDLTNVSAVKMYVNHNQATGSPKFGLYVCSALSMTKIAYAESTTAGYKTLTLDVAALSGMYYIAAYVEAAVNGYSNGYIHQVYLER